MDAEILSFTFYLGYYIINIRVIIVSYSRITYRRLRYGGKSRQERRPMKKTRNIKKAKPFAAPALFMAFTLLTAVFV
jgi:hypothetical protein